MCTTCETCRANSVIKTALNNLHQAGPNKPIYDDAWKHKFKFVNVKQAKTYYNYKNNKRKIYRINAAIWYNKKCKIHVHLPVPSACTLYIAP